MHSCLYLSGSKSTMNNQFLCFVYFLYFTGLFFYRKIIRGVLNVYSVVFHLNRKDTKTTNYHLFLPTPLFLSLLPSSHDSLQSKYLPDDFRSFTLSNTHVSWVQLHLKSTMFPFTITPQNLSVGVCKYKKRECKLSASAPKSCCSTKTSKVGEYLGVC